MQPNAQINPARSSFGSFPLHHKLIKLGVYSFLGMIVFVRLIILWQHSWRHYFFTYRALAASVLALCFIVLELIESTYRKAVPSDV